MSARRGTESTNSARSESSKKPVSKKSNSPYNNPIKKEESPLVRRNKDAMAKKMELEGVVYSNALSGKGVQFGEYYEMQRELAKLQGSESSRSGQLTPSTAKRNTDGMSLQERLLAGTGAGGMKVRVPKTSVDDEMEAEDHTPSPPPSPPKPMAQPKPQPKVTPIATIPQPQPTVKPISSIKAPAATRSAPAKATPSKPPASRATAPAKAPPSKAVAARSTPAARPSQGKTGITAAGRGQSRPAPEPEPEPEPEPQEEVEPEPEGEEPAPLGQRQPPSRTPVSRQGSELESQRSTARSIDLDSQRIQRPAPMPSFPDESQWPEMMAKETLDAIWEHSIKEYKQKHSSN